MTGMKITQSLLGMIKKGVKKMTVGKLKDKLRKLDDNNEVRIEVCYENGENHKVSPKRVESIIFDVYLREKDNKVIISNI